jgi:SAM-dependent methyltransferase
MNPPALPNQSIRRNSPYYERVRAFFDGLAPDRTRWVERNAFFYRQDVEYLRFLIPRESSVLEVGCGNGHLLAALNPSRGVGIDISPKMISVARETFPQHVFIAGNAEIEDDLLQAGGPFDFIVVSDTIGLVEDCEQLFLALRSVAGPHTRIVVSYYSRLWQPILSIGERSGVAMPQMPQSWLSTQDTMSLLALAGYESVRREWRTLLPKRFFGLGTLINRYIAPLPLVRRFCLRNFIVARMRALPVPEHWPSVSVIVPCRNERGNIEAAVTRLPQFGSHQEIIYVEGHSQDGTYEECERVRAAYPEYSIKVFRQEGKGKGDAVRKGFTNATGDIVMILDADLTVPPETMPKFYSAIARGIGEFVNGTRLVYPMQSGAMRTLNLIANRGFARIFSYLLNQRFTDTLCGTKVLWRRDYEHIAANRHYFGEFDPFGDFDLLFGAAKLNLKMVELPIRYADRSYGETQISRFSHGWLLVRMVVFAWRKMKAF